MNSSPFQTKVDYAKPCRRWRLVTSIQLITILMFRIYFLSTKKESSKEIRLAGALTGKKTSVFSLPAARVRARRVFTYPLFSKKFIACLIVSILSGKLLPTSPSRSLVNATKLFISKVFACTEKIFSSA